MQRAGVRKPPKKEPAGSGERFAVYGDLSGGGVWRGMILAVVAESWNAAGDCELAAAAALDGLIEA